MHRASLIAPEREWPWPRWAWLVPAIALAPFVVLLPLAIPQFDDFCFGGFWRELGLVGMLEFYYRTFVGRLFANTVIAVPFIIQEWTGGDLLAVYRILCAVVFAGVVALAVWTVRRFFPAARPGEIAFLALALLAAMVGGAPSPNDLYFWISQIANYTLAAIAAFAIMVVMWMRAERAASLPPAFVAAIAATGFLTAMATEISGIILCVIVVGAYVRRWLEPGARPQTAAHLLILAAICIGALIVVTAPGTSARVTGTGQTHGVIATAIYTFPMTMVRLANYIYLRLVSPALVAWPIVVALATYHYDRGGAAAPKPRWTVVWLPLVTVIVATTGVLWIGQMGNGGFVPPRTRGHLHFVLLAGLTQTTIHATRAYGERLRRWLVGRHPRLRQIHVAVAALVLMVAAPNAIRAGWTALAKRPALAAAIDERFATLAAARGQSSILELPLLPIRSWPVVWGDITRDETDWENRCLARYYGLPSVRLAAPAP